MTGQFVVSELAIVCQCRIGHLSVSGRPRRYWARTSDNGCSAAERDRPAQTLCIYPVTRARAVRGLMRMARDCAVVSAGLVAVDRVLPATVRVTLPVATARTVTTLVRVAPAGRAPSEKHRVRPERVAPPVRVTTRFCGSLRQEVTEAAVAVPALVVRMPRRMA